MAFTTDDLTAIETAIARGVRVVQFADRSTTYSSTDELLKVREVIRASLSTRARQTLGVATSKGFDC